MNLTNSAFNPKGLLVINKIVRLFYSSIFIKIRAYIINNYSYINLK